MDTNALKKFAQAARNLLIDQVTSKLDLVLVDGSAARRQHPQAMKDLDQAIARDGKNQVIEQVAYTWFNRFTALRFMDANSYTAVGIVSPAEGQTRPEVLAEAMAGNLPEGAPVEVAALLDGRRPSSDPQAEAYRQLLVHACNQWHGPMPFLFEEIDDYTELLMPEDLLSQTSILAELRKVMTEDACQDVEIIGWLYQFYISEKKDQVFAGLKKNQKITAENIPAATQLFTPHWIVRYLVENSLGRLWLLNRPHSRLAERMDYYIAPEEPETDFLRITRPEDIRICDPAAGSGHMLTYAFDLLHAIYEEEGYDATEIPALILTRNLTGVEIDDRAGALAAFALAMKAAAKLGRRRFLRMEAKPDICVLQNVAFTEAEMQDVAAVVGKDLFTDELRETLGQFEQAKNFGSLIVPKLRDPAETLRVVEARDFGGDLLLKEVQERVIGVLRMAEALSPKYHVVVANPPYMSGKGLNLELNFWLRKIYPEHYRNLYSAFFARIGVLGEAHGACCGLMVPSTWMTISTQVGMRRKFMSKYFLHTLLHLNDSSFEHATVPICALTFNNFKAFNKSLFVDLTAAKSAKEEIEIVTNLKNFSSLTYIKNLDLFREIPEEKFLYAAPDEVIHTFSKLPKLGEVGSCRAGMATKRNEIFVRYCWEVADLNVGIRFTRAQARDSGRKWFPYANGGAWRKWSGNFEEVVNWEGDGHRLLTERHPGKGGRIISVNHNLDYIFKAGLVWSAVGHFAMRELQQGSLFSSAANAFFPELPDERNYFLAAANSNSFHHIFQFSSPSVSNVPGELSKMPVPPSGVAGSVTELISISRTDWNSYETSWDFTTLPLLSPDHRGETLADSYAALRAHWQSMTDEMNALEEENNRIFIDAYGLQDELTPEVPLNEVTLTCNPAYRYGIKNDAAANETRLRADTMAEFLSYAVGCMFGRYSLDAPGLILANQGETLADYLARIPEPRFMPDEDNVIPVLDADWFPDDITERFRLFLRTTFGEAHFRENLRYIEDALGKDIRKYFTKDFYADHVKRYKKRPIYWMFASPKGSFQALVYMHRYRSDTVSVVLNDYLREFISKLEGERGRLEKLSDDPSASQAQRTRALKDMAAVGKQIEELNAWERDVVFPMAQQKIEIDLDDGVKANYPKFGGAVKKIAGLEAKDD